MRSPKVGRTLVGRGKVRLDSDRSCLPFSTDGLVELRLSVHCLGCVSVVGHLQRPIKSFNQDRKCSLPRTKMFFLVLIF